jgi:RNA polymerase sigma factor (sigma-70 family)
MDATILGSNQSQEAWKSFKRGDFNALGILFEIYYHELFYYGIKIVNLPELVKDIIQDLFANVWERRNKMTTIDNFKAYLIISLRHELIRRLSLIRKESNSEEMSTFQFSFSPEEFLILDEETKNHSRLLSESMSRLTERQREVILLRFFHNLDFEQIGRALDMNVQSVRNLLFRSLEKIRKDMSDIGIKGVEDVEILLWFFFGKKNCKKSFSD